MKLEKIARQQSRVADTWARVDVDLAALETTLARLEADSALPAPAPAPSRPRDELDDFDGAAVERLMKRNVPGDAERALRKIEFAALALHHRLDALENGEGAAPAIVYASAPAAAQTPAPAGGTHAAAFDFLANRR